MKLSKIVRNSVLALAAAALLPLSPALAQGSGGQTTVKVYNSSNNSVQVWLTLGAYSTGNYPSGNPGFIQNVSSVNFNPPVGISPTGPLQGSFNLGAGKMTSITMPVGTSMSGNFCFGTPPNICPAPQFPNGMNLAEFTVNTNTPAYVNAQVPNPQEALDISCVNGVNAKIKYDLYAAAGSGSWSTTNNPNVTTFANKPFGDLATKTSPNVNTVGVFSVGCDNCTTSADPGTCPSQPGLWNGWNLPNPANTICNIQRQATKSGGTVLITFSGFYPVPAVSSTVKKP